MGVLVAILLIVIVLFSVGAAMSAGGKTNKTAEKGVLKLTLNAAIPEKTDNVETSFGDTPGSTLGLRHMVRLLENAAKDDNIKGVVIQASSVQTGQATLLQLRNAIASFKEGRVVSVPEKVLEHMISFFASTSRVSGKQFIPMSSCFI